jgi:hypothetical protein
VANQSLTSAAINVGSSGDNTLVAGVAGKIIRVLNFVLMPAANVACKFTDGPGGIGLTGPMSIGTTGLYPGWVPQLPGGFTLGHFETSPGNALVLNLGSATQVCGYVNYILAPQ